MATRDVIASDRKARENSYSTQRYDAWRQAQAKLSQRRVSISVQSPRRLRARWRTRRGACRGGGARASVRACSSDGPHTRSSGAWHPSPAGASARVLRARQPSISLAGLGTDATKRDARLGRAHALLSPLRASPLAGTACVCARFPSTTTSRVSSVTFARWPRTRPASRPDAGPAARDGGGAALEDGRDDDAAFRERAGERRRTPSLRVALVGRAAADDDDLVTCAHAVMENGGGHDRENDVAPGAGRADWRRAPRGVVKKKAFALSSRAGARHLRGRDDRAPLGSSDGTSRRVASRRAGGVRFGAWPPGGAGWTPGGTLSC